MSSGVAWTAEETRFLNRMIATVSPTLYDRGQLEFMRQRALSEKLYPKGQDMDGEWNGVLPVYVGGNGPIQLIGADK